MENTCLAQPLNNLLCASINCLALYDTQDSIKQSVSKTTFEPEEHLYIHNDDAAEGGGCVGFPSCLHCRTD